MKRIMDFLFGKKPPIFNSKGDIEHQREVSFSKWKERYENDVNYNWKNHSGMIYQKETKK